MPMSDDDENPTRTPRLPPFPVGTRLRCVDKARQTSHGTIRFGRDGSTEKERRDTSPESKAWVTIYGYGIEVTIDSVRPGHRGTGREIHLDEDDEGFIDSTRDGRSVYHVEGTSHGRSISAEDKAHWKIVKERP